jgi:TfoX/Sxy family transcriptional regulator of competence genes
MPKAAPRAAAQFEELCPSGPGIVRRLMFGNPSAFVAGHMFFGVFGDDLFLRLAPADQGAAQRLPGAHLFEPMAGRPMQEYVVLPGTVWDDRALATRWITKAVAYTQRLPPKSGKTGPPRRTTESPPSPAPRPRRKR